MGKEAESPLSSLYVALGRMTSLKRLRVFQCRQGLPFTLAQGPHIRSESIAARMRSRADSN